MTGLQARIWVPGLAIALAAAPIFSVILAVVLGLITLIFMAPREWNGGDLYTNIAYNPNHNRFTLIRQGSYLSLVYHWLVPRSPLRQEHGFRLENFR